MKSLLLLSLLFSFTAAAQTVDTPLSREAMLKDLRLFREIREAANSGLYAYRTRAEIDSSYGAAERQIEQAETLLDFYVILCALTDFEGSLHNDTDLPREATLALWDEPKGYFPYPLIQLQGKTVVNFDTTDIPAGAEILRINGEAMVDILPKFYKFYTTDGYNLSGKRVGITRNFPMYYRYVYGQQDTFTVDYRPYGEAEVRTGKLPSIGYRPYYRRFKRRHSLPLDSAAYVGFRDILASRSYSFGRLSDSVGKLTVNSFLIGWNEKDERHLAYTRFLDSVFTVVQQDSLTALVVDVRHNGGGTDPNDMVTYAYLTDRTFVENTEAWVAADRVPYWRYLEGKPFFLIRPIAKWLYGRQLRKEFPDERDGKFYADDKSKDHQPRQPQPNAFTGPVYLMVSPRIASAGSMFASMLAGNDNVTVVGEEPMGGYWTHNGHQPITYTLPESGISTTFSVVHLRQDVVDDPNQPRGRGVLPDVPVQQTIADFLIGRDTQLERVRELVRTR